MADSSLWQRFQQYLLGYDDVDFSIDISRMKFPDDFFPRMRPAVEKAFRAMHELEAGAMANPDEKRMVGHYWLCNPSLAPSADLRRDIEETNRKLSAPGKTAEELAHDLGADPEDVFHILWHLAGNDPAVKASRADEPADDKFSI